MLRKKLKGLFVSKFLATKIAVYSIKKAVYPGFKHVLIVHFTAIVKKISKIGLSIISNSLISRAVAANMNLQSISDN